MLPTVNTVAVRQAVAADIDVGFAELYPSYSSVTLSSTCHDVIAAA